MNRCTLFVAAHRRIYCDRFSSSSSSTSSNLLLPELYSTSKRIYLLRHGETDWNKLGKMQGGGFDIPLNDNGIQQAQKAAEVLLTSSNIALDVICSSHLQRASKTADIVHASSNKQAHAATGAKRIIMPEFGEFRFGKFEGMALHGENKDDAMKKEFDQINVTIYEDLRAKWPGGESTGDVDTRMRSGLDQLLLASASSKHIAIVGHGRSNRILLASLMYDDPLKHQDIQQGNTCINVLDVDEKGVWTPQLINYVEHIKS
jgi:broad specificity phosphatase PhoE